MKAVAVAGVLLRRRVCVPGFRKDSAHLWFRITEAPLIIEPKVRLRLTLARCVPLLLCVQVTTLVDLLLWRVFTRLVDSTDVSPQSLFVLLFAVTVVPPLVVAVVPWLVRRNQRRLALWAQSLCGALLIPLTSFVCPPRLPPGWVYRN